MQDDLDISGAVERILDNDCDGGARVYQDTVRALVGLVVGERERCARVAEANTPVGIYAGSYRISDACAIIAEQIRDGEPAWGDRHIQEAAEALVSKLDECGPHIGDAFVMREMRAGPYTGPNYGAELEALRAAIRSPVSSFGGR